jgi:hypothetical protein
MKDRCCGIVPVPGCQLVCHNNDMLTTNLIHIKKQDKGQTQKRAL